MPTCGSRPVLLRRMYMMTLTLETPVLEMQGAGLTPLNFAICLLRIGGHLGRQEALRFVGYKYIYLLRVSPHMRSSWTRAAAHMRSTASGGAAEQPGRRDPSRCKIFSMKIYFQTVLFGIIKPAARAAAFTPKTCTPPSSHSCRAAVRLPCARALYNQWGCHFNSYDQAIFYQHVDALAYTLWGWVDSDWAADLDSHRSHTGYLIMLNCGAVSWKSRLQDCVSLGSHARAL
jgi:hypothetical protein